MKQVKFTVICFLVTFGLQATVIQVDNNAGASADYALLQDAIDNANFGDTIYVAGSPNDYDPSTTIRLNKRLVLIGPGYFLGENFGLANNQTAKLYNLVIGAGANDAVVMGFDCSRYQSNVEITNENADGSSSTNPPSGIFLRRNLIYDLLLEGSGHVIEKNYVLAPVYIYSPFDNSIIQNNIFLSKIDGFYISESLTNVIIKNNVIAGVDDLNGIEITNNVFINDSGIDNCDNGQVKNNVFTTSESNAIKSTSTGNTIQDNLYGQAEGTLFVDPSPSIDSEYQLSNGSPAEGAGFGGVDAGAFGGSTTYVISGVPAIPSITELTTTGSGTTSEGIQVRVKAKTNQ